MKQKQKIDKPEHLIKRWILSSLIKGDKKTQEILNEHKNKYFRRYNEYLIYNHIDKNIEKLMKWGIVELINSNPKKYHMREGCFSGLLVYGIRRNEVLLIMCTNPTECNCSETEKIKQINEKCMYWDILKTLEPGFKIRL